jgi:hypothetical protein
MPVQNRIQIRRGTAAAGSYQWTNQVLYAGEMGYETDTGKFKIGDGSTVWSSLPYSSILPSELTELVQDVIGSSLTAGSGVSVSYNDTTGNTSISLSNPTVSAGDVTGLSEAIDDRANDLLKAGSNIQLTYDDNANTLTIATTGVALSGHTHTLSQGATDVTATAAEVNYLDLSGSIGTAEASKAIVLDANKDFTGIRNLTVSGDLTVNGTMTTINSTTVTVDDKNLELGSVASPSDSTADGGGITLKGTTDKEWKWVDATDSWTSSEHINLNSSSLTYKLNGTTVISNTTIGASGYSLASGMIIDGGTP